MASEAQRRYWIIVSSPENFRRTVDHGFTMQGIKSRHRKKAERMAPGDKLVYYLTGWKAFAAIATITSAYFESTERIWESGNPKKATEDYPFRVQVSADIVLAAEDAVAAEPIARVLTYAKKWPPEHWTLAFQGNVHEIDQGDYSLIREAVEASTPVTTG